MDLTLLDEALWAASFAGNAALFAVLLYRRRWKDFPVFTCWIFYEIVLTIVLFAIYRLATPHLYAVVYWGADGLDFLIQLAVVFEIARIVLRPTGTWLRDARTRFLLGSSLALAFAVAIVFLVHPSAPSHLGVWAIRGNLFTSLVICEMYLAMIFSANRLGLQWRNHVMGLGQALSLWAVISFFVDALHTLLGWRTDYVMLENMRSSAWLVATIIWTVVFWMPEPERLPLSPAMQKYLIDLHESIRYDLQKIGPQ